MLGHLLIGKWITGIRDITIPVIFILVVNFLRCHEQVSYDTYYMWDTVSYLQIRTSCSVFLVACQYGTIPYHMILCIAHVITNQLYKKIRLTMATSQPQTRFAIP